MLVGPIGLCRASRAYFLSVTRVSVNIKTNPVCIGLLKQGLYIFATLFIPRKYASSPVVL